MSMTLGPLVEDTTRDHFVYWLYDADGAPLYIGCTKNLHGRRYDHWKKPWWPEVASWRVRGPYTREVALDRERVAIFTEQPRHNVAHTQTACTYGHSLADAYLYTDRLGYQRRDCRSCAKEKAFRRRRRAALARANGRHLARAST